MKFRKQAKKKAYRAILRIWFPLVKPLFIKPVAGDVVSWMDADGKLQSITLENPLP